jgi:hypothetical protein
MAKRAVRNPPPEAEKKKFPDDLDVKLARGWQDFKKRMEDFNNNIATSTVELTFESQYDEKTFYSFAPDEALFVDDIVVSPKSKVVFSVPFGAKHKFFTFGEADCIQTKSKKDGEVESLDRVINRNFRESFKDELPDVSSISILERKYLQPHTELRDVFNNVDFFLKQYEENKNKGQIYQKIDNFGIF